MKFLVLTFFFIINLTNAWAISVTRFNCVDAAQEWKVNVGISGVGDSSQGVLVASLKNWRIAYINLDKSIPTDFGTIYGPSASISFNVDQINGDYFLRSVNGVTRLKCDSTTKDELPSFCPTRSCTRDGMTHGQKEVFPGYICHSYNLHCKV